MIFRKKKKRVITKYRFAFDISFETDDDGKVILVPNSM